MADISKTYKQIAEEFVEQNRDKIIDGFGEISAIELFAQHLDGFTTLDMHMQIIAMTKTAQINQEIFDEIFREFKDKKELARLVKVYKTVLSKHKKHVPHSLQNLDTTTEAQTKTED